MFAACSGVYRGHGKTFDPKKGSKKKAEALGRVVTHTAYHAGQLALVVKYGSPQ